MRPPPQWEHGLIESLLDLLPLGYHSAMLLLRQLAEALQAEYVPRSKQAGEKTFSPAECVERVASARNATGTSLTFAESEATLQEALGSAAAAVLVTPQVAKAFLSKAQPLPKPLLAVAQPRLAFAQAAQYLRAAQSSTGVHRTAILASSVKLAEDVSIGPYAVLGEHVAIGARTRIGAGCVLADGVRVGADCTLHPRVVLYSGVELRDRVQVHAGCVLGSDGFGYVRDAKTGAYTQFPQQGTLTIEDDVEIGANTTIDRGALEETRIARGTKLDNLVHIGHNVRVGRNGDGGADRHFRQQHGGRRRDFRRAGGHWRTCRGWRRRDSGRRRGRVEQKEIARRGDGLLGASGTAVAGISEGPGDAGEADPLAAEREGLGLRPRDFVCEDWRIPGLRSETWGTQIFCCMKKHRSLDWAWDDNASGCIEVLRWRLS